MITSDDLNRLVLTRGYELLLTGVGAMNGAELEVQRLVNSLVSTELTERVDAFKAAIAALEEQINRWSQLGEFIMPDTSFYIEHPEKLEKVDFALLLGVRGANIRVLIPIVVVDELDGLKQNNKQHVRWRAGYTLAVLDRLFASSTNPARLRTEDFSALSTGGIPRGEVTIEMVFDPPRHTRLPINDDEIVDRALAIEPLASREVTLLTYDTGQAMRARVAGVPVKKLSKEPAGEQRS